MKKTGPRNKPAAKGRGERARNALLTEVFENAFDAIMILRDGVFIECNGKTLELFDCTREEFLQSTPYDFSPPSQGDCRDSREKAMEMMDRAHAEGTHVFDWRHRKNNGAVFDAEVVLRSFTLGKFKYLQATVRDITARIAANAALRESEEKYRFLVENINDTILIMDARGRITYASPVVTRLTGYEVSELAGRPVLEFIHPDDLTGARDRVTRILAGSLQVAQSAYRIRTRSGAYRWFQTSSRIAPDASGVKTVTVVLSDITERKAAEDSLARSRERFEKVFYSTPVISAISDVLTGVYVEVNDSFTRATGYTREETIGKTSMELGLWVRPEHRAQVIGDVHSTLGPVAREILIRAKSGEVRTLAFSADTITYDDGKEYLLTSAVDITELKMAETELRLQRELITKTTESVPGLIFQFSMSPTGSITMPYASAWCESVFGLSPEALREDVRSLIALIHPDDLDDLSVSIVRSAEMLAPWQWEGRFFDRKGEVRYLRGDSKPEKLPDGTVLWNGVLIDITDRRKAEEALRESGERLRTLINAMPDIVCFKDGAGHWLEANEFNLKLFEIEGVDYKGRKDSELADFSPYFRETLLACETADEQAWRAREPVRGDEMIPRRDGHPMTFDIIKVPTYDSDGRRKGLVVVGRDVTERKRAEKLIRLQRDLAAALSGTVELREALGLVLDFTLQIEGFDSGGIYLKDQHTGGLNLSVSHGLSEGFMQMEARYSADSANTRMVLKGEPIYMEYPRIIENLTGVPLDGIRKKEGILHLAIIPIRHGGAVIGCLNLASRSLPGIPQFSRDALESIGVQVGGVIGRLRAEQTIRDSLAEKEMLLKEIHHRVKNNMQIISSLLQLQIYRLHDPRDQDLVMNLQNSVRSMALVHEKLYRSESMARIHIAPYIRDLTNEMLQFNPIAERVTISIDAGDMLLSIDEAVPCGLIINELITNALKHAFPGTEKGVIEIRFGPMDGKRLLVIRDNGAGIAESVDLQKPASLGMRLVNALLKQLAGTMEVVRSGGTEFRILF
ncbi:MAG: PAS domain S-box protein [Spirochaetes bacterium]|nr:MAG: PAS domain S-box protein [Spirochaetota bacterium]